MDSSIRLAARTGALHEPAPSPATLLRAAIGLTGRLVRFVFAARAVVPDAAYHDMETTRLHLLKG